jgi:hypothetical protein
MVKIIFVCLVLALGLWGCDDCTPGIKASCRTPENLGECPAETLMRPKVCKAAACSIDEGSQSIGTIDLTTCDFPDCFTMDCEIGLGDALFDIETYPEGIVSIEGADPIDYRCLPLHGDVPTC